MLYFTDHPNERAPRYVWLMHEGPVSVVFRTAQDKTATCPRGIFFSAYQLVTAEHIDEIAWAVRERMKALALAGEGMFVPLIPSPSLPTGHIPPAHS